MFKPAAIFLLPMLLPAAGLAAEQQYSLTNFDTVRMQGPFTVVITTGKGNSARGEGDRSALDRVALNVSGGVLTIRTLAPRMGARESNAGRATLYITTTLLRRVTMGGSGAMRIQGLKGVRGDLSLAGSGDLEVNDVAVDQLVLNSAGNGRVRLAGRAGSARIQVIGAADVEAPGLVAKTVTIDSQGPGSITLTAADAADISVKGAGNVTVLGRPACKLNQAGSGEVVCGSE